MRDQMTRQYPSLELAYKQVKDVLSEQEQTASSLDTKAATLLAISTAIFGIGMPLILSLLNIHGIVKITNLFQAGCIGVLTSSFVGFVLLSWITVIKRAITAYRLRNFITMNNPEEIRLKMWHMPQSEFYHEILINIEIAFHKNDKQLIQKANLIDKTMEWLLIEIVSSFSLLLFLGLLKAAGLT